MNTTLDPDTPIDEPPTSSDTDAPARRSRRKRIWIIVLVVVGLLAAAAGAGIWWFLRDDAPPEVTLDAAIETLDETTGSDGDADAAETAAATDDTATVDETTADESTADAGESGVAAADGVTGTWVVDTELGEFDYESATGSFVGFRIEEELRSIGSTTAVGRTGDVAGTIVIDGTTLVEATFEVDTAGITTNDSRRDDNVWDALEVDDFPTASFVLSEPIELGASAAEGEAISVVATGELTIHGVTQQVEVALEAQLVDDVVVVVGSTDMTFSDYGVEVPDGGPVISVDDFGVVELQLLFTR